MKTIITSLLLLATTVAFSQSIRLLQGNTDVTGTTVSMKIELEQYVTAKFTLYNSSDKDKQFRVTRIRKSKLQPEYYIGPFLECIEYMPMEDSILTVGNAVNLKAKSYLQSTNSSCMGLEVYLYTKNECKDYIFSFILWEVGGKDSSEVTLHYTCANAINEHHSRGTISNVYPNPVTHSAFFDYQIQTSFTQAKIVLADVLGRQVKELPVENQEGHVIMNTSDLPQGFYTYQFLIDDHAIDSGKLIVHPAY